MKVLVTAVGQRTEHWTDLFAELADQPDMELSVAVADVSPLTHSTMQKYAGQSRIRYHRLRHVLSESTTGHMASVVFSPRALRDYPSGRPDVIHIIGEPAYLSTAQIFRWRDRRWPGVPITHYAAQNVPIAFPAPFPRLERRVYERTAHMFPITPSALSVLRGKGYRGAATVMPLGVDSGLFTRVPPRRSPAPFTVGFVGRLEPHKGIRDLLRVADQLNCHLHIIGAGSEEQLVLAAAARRPGQVVLRPWADHDELPALLSRLDVLVLPSLEVVQRNVLPWVGIPLREQFGRVLVEAMSCGIPVVGSNTGEIPYVIGDAGLIFPAGDTLALHDCLVRLRDNPSLRSQLGQRGIHRVNAEFTWRRTAAGMRRAWDGLPPAAGQISADQHPAHPSRDQVTSWSTQRR